MYQKENAGQVSAWQHGLRDHLGALCETGISPVTFAIWGKTRSGPRLSVSITIPSSCDSHFQTSGSILPKPYPGSAKQDLEKLFSYGKTWKFLAEKKNKTILGRGDHIMKKYVRNT